MQREVGMTGDESQSEHIMIGQRHWHIVICSPNFVQGTVVSFLLFESRCLSSLVLVFCFILLFFLRAGGGGGRGLLRTSNFQCTEITRISDMRLCRKFCSRTRRASAFDCLGLQACSLSFCFCRTLLSMGGTKFCFISFLHCSISHISDALALARNLHCSELFSLCPASALLLYLIGTDNEDIPAPI